MKEEWLMSGAVVPVDVDTTTALVAEIKRLIDVVGGLVLKQGPDYERGFVDGMQKQMQSSVDRAVNRMAQPEQEPVGRFAKFTDGIWREVTDGSSGMPLYTTPPAQPAPVQEPEHKGCACRWDGEGDRTVTCERHEGWLEVIAEWADRAREAEAKLKAAAQRQPLTEDELRVIENKINPNMRWRSSDEEGITLYPNEYYDLVKAIEAAHGIGKKK